MMDGTSQGRLNFRWDLWARLASGRSAEPQHFTLMRVSMFSSVLLMSEHGLIQDQTAVDAAVGLAHSRNPSAAATCLFLGDFPTATSFGIIVRP